MHLIDITINPTQRKRKQELPPGGDYRKLGGQVSFGWRKIGGLLKVHKREQQIIEELRKLRADGNSYGDLVDWLHAHGIRSKNGGRWDRPTVYKILKRVSP